MAVTMIELIAPYPRQTELETTIIEIVQTQRGLKGTELWMLVMADMNRKPGARETVTPAIIAETIHHLMGRGDLTGINYTFGAETNAFVLPGNTQLEMVRPSWIKRNPNSIL
jgi:hypothetical protein